MDVKVLMLPGSQLTVNVADRDEQEPRTGVSVPPDAPVPDEIQLAPLGEFTDADGNRFAVTPPAIAAMIASFAQKANNVPVDYEHQTLTGGKAPAAGWITELLNKGADGLWGKVKWTAKATEYLAHREYRYLSPVLLANKKDGAGRYVPSRLHSAALTNTPQIDGMVPIVNKGFLTHLQEDPMLKKIRLLLGLQESAPDMQVEETIIALKGRPAVAPELAEALGLQPDASGSEAKATVLAMKQNAAAREGSDGRIAELEKRLSLRDADEAVTLAMKEGKITEAQKPWAMDYAARDLPGFKMFAGKAVAVVPMGAIPAANGGKPAGGLTEATKLIAMKMGIGIDRIEKQGGIE